MTNPKIENRHKRRLINTLGISRVNYTAGTWPCLKKQEQALWHARIMALYRLTISRWGEEEKHLSDINLRETLKVLAPKDHADIAVMWQLLSIAKWADEAYLAPFLELDEFHEEKGWTGRCIEIYNRLLRMRPTMPGPFERFWELIESLQTEEARSNLRKLTMRHTKQCLHAQTERVRISAMNQEVTVTADWCEGYECLICGVTFASKTALAVHNRHRHRVYAKASHFAPGTTCFACARTYHTRARLIQHLQYGSMDCLQKLQRRILPLTTQQVEDLAQGERNHQREANKQGRKTREQKISYVQNGFDFLSDMVGHWDEHISLVDFDEEELTEKETLLQWDELIDLLGHWENLEDDESREIAINMIRQRGSQVKSPRVLWWWLNDLEHELRAMRDVCGEAEQNATIFVKIRWELLYPHVDV